MEKQLEEIKFMTQENAITIRQILTNQRRIFKLVDDAMKTLQKSFQLIANAQYNFSEELSEWAGTVTDRSMDTNLF